MMKSKTSHPVAGQLAEHRAAKRKRAVPAVRLIAAASPRLLTRRGSVTTLPIPPSSSPSSDPRPSAAIRGYSSRLLTRRGSVPAFTLIEIIIVMTIIAILVAIVVTGGKMMTNTAHANNTRTILKELAGIATDYQTRTGSYVVPPANSYGAPNSYVSIDYFVTQVKANSPDTAKMFDNIAKAFTVRNSSTNELIAFKDSWGHYIRYTAFGSLSDGLPHRATGGTVAGSSPQPYFASAGPDGKWGQVNSDNQLDADAKDNVYSFDLRGHITR